MAYGASIGGVATLVGTPPNLSFARILTIHFPNAPEISFATWFLFAFPISLLLLAVACVVLCVMFGIRGRKSSALNLDVIRSQYNALGPLAFEEKVVLADFVALALLWLSRRGIQIGDFQLPGWSRLFEWSAFFNDGTVAMGAALILFLIPAMKKGRVMEWETASELPWHIVLLFGGGFALATGFKESGLSMWFAHQLEGLSGVHPVVLVGVTCLMITFLTELTSNTATAEMFLPIMAALSVAVKVNPLLLMIPATLSCSFAFMLPVATPPNAIVFGTDRVRMGEMVRVGLVLNLVGAVVITAGIYVFGSVVLGIDASVMPDWARLE